MRASASSNSVLRRSRGQDAHAEILYVRDMRIVASMLLVALFTVEACKSEPGPSLPHSPSTSARSEDASTTATKPAPSTPSTARAEAVTDVCRSDTDCVLSTFAGCCASCPCRDPRALTRSRELDQTNICRLVDCLPEKEGPRPACPACIDPEREGMAARCIDSVCTLVETSRKKAPTSSSPPPAAVDCRTEDDCWIDTTGSLVRRPNKLRGRKIRPCEDSEHTPACEKGACVVKVWKC